jgi:hypothetical protein
MGRSTLEQQQQHSSRSNEILIRKTRDLLNDRIAQKRWEFQHTEFNPQKLWHIANVVEALNWISHIFDMRLKHDRPFSDYCFESLVVSLSKALARINKYLDNSSKDNYDGFSNLDRLKSRAAVIEWSLFQIHFLSTNIYRGTIPHTSRISY